MPTSKNKKQKQAAPLRPIWRRKLFWLLVVVILLVGASLITPIMLREQKEKAVAAERARFEQADKDVKEVADAIIAAVGQPYKVSENKYCSRPSTKWEEAPLSCAVVNNVLYEINNENDANTVVHKIQQIAGREWKYLNSTQSSNLTEEGKFSKLDERDYDKLLSHQSIFFKYENKKIQMKCDISNALYKSEQPPFEEYIINSTSPYALAISIDCTEEAKEAHFALGG